MQGATVSSSYQYEVIRPPEGSPYYQSVIPNAILASMHQQSAMAASPASVSSHELMHRSSVEAYEADLEANALRMINLLKEENKKLRTELDSYIKKAFKLQQVS